MKTPASRRMRTRATSRCRRSTTCLTRSQPSSERHLYRELRLPRVADALPEEAVEVEERRRRQRVNVVGVVERVEHLEARNHLSARSHAERTLKTPIKRKVLVVLPIPVAPAIDAVQDARGGGDRLRSTALQTHVDQELPRQLHISEEVDF